MQVHAAGLDRGTEHLMTGKPYAMRLGFGLRRPKNPVSGRDVAGTVAQVGSSVTRFAVGDEVYGVAPGSFAEYAVAKEDKLARKPANLTFAQAAVVPMSGGTALQALHDVGQTASRASPCWFSARPAASAPTPSSWPRPSGPRSPGCAAPRRSTSSPPSAPTTSSTTATQDFADGTRRTTSSSTSAAARP